jgi:hypothetical protein
VLQQFRLLKGATLAVATAALFAVTATTAGAATWERAANQGGSFTVSGVKAVRYGTTNGPLVMGYRMPAFRAQMASGRVDCNSAYFGGDPAPGISKYCEVSSVSYRKVADEGSAYWADRPMEIAYGAHGALIGGSSQWGVNWCTNWAFGGDPAPGCLKSCWAPI